jgi:hypothetical protein
MKNYHLTPKGDRWELTEEGGSAVATYDSKEEGIESSRRVVAEESGSLKIHHADGTVDEERTCPRSKDPETSPG